MTDLTPQQPQSPQAEPVPTGGQPDVPAPAASAPANESPRARARRRWSRSGGGLRRARQALLLAGVLAAGVALGFAGHGRIGHWLGLHDHASSPGDKKQLWTCGMHPQVLKEEPGLCPICQMKLEPLDVVAAGGSAMPGAGTGEGGGPAGGRKVKYWWDPMMNPPYIAQQPGKSPMGMDLVPVYEDEARAAGGSAVRIDPVVVQNMGVRLSSVARGPIRRDVRAVGYLTEAEPNIRDVNLRVSGWIEKLTADTVGMAVSKGSPLFELYSPDVQVGVEELIAARRSVTAATGPAIGTAAGRSARSLYDAARRKLELWGLEAEQVEQLSRLETAPRAVTFASPIDGYLTQKMVVQGAAVKSGDAVLRIVDLSTVWLDAQVHAQDLPVVSLGQPVAATVEGVPGRRFEGKVVFIAPQVDPQSRTATVRVALPNNELTLRPGMFAAADLTAELAADAVLIPREAVIDTGTRRVVFVAVGEGHFEPRDVRVGVDGDGGTVQVLSGVTVGEQVVTSGQFLLDAESRMREAIQKHLSDRLAAGGKPPGVSPAAHAGHAQSPASGPTAGAQSRPVPSAVAAEPGRTEGATAEADPVFHAYLAVQAVLGAPQQASAVPVDLDPLGTAAKRLAETGTGDAARHARALAAAAEAMRGRPLPEQRKLYKAVSDAAIALAAVAPPSRAVADRLFVVNCPMAPGEGGRWLQPTPDVANPYFATSMKACGTVERAIAQRPDTRPAPAAPGDHAGHGTTNPKDGER